MPITSKKAKEYIDTSIKNQKLASAYLISWESNDYNAELDAIIFAKNFAYSINDAKNKIIALSDYTSATFAQKDIEKSEYFFNLIVPESKSQKITISQINKAQEFLSKSPLNNKYNVLIVWNVHDMTISSANAFLKILEEPPDDALIILASSNKQKLLDTIKSRCFTIEIFSEKNYTKIFNSLIEDELEDAFSLIKNNKNLFKKNIQEKTLFAFNLSSTLQISIQNIKNKINKNYEQILKVEKNKYKNTLNPEIWQTRESQLKNKANQDTRHYTNLLIDSLLIYSQKQKYPSYFLKSFIKLKENLQLNISTKYAIENSCFNSIKTHNK